jgi:2-C-methyl-D-erythritol 4-phosphate cytidylyltransferase/2-C-methyl-D-erythritol 2,4-cyclodiphosphate synthase
MVNNLRVVIAAAGRGSRMESSTNKQYLLLNSRPVLAYSLDFFEKLDVVDEIVVVTGEKDLNYCEREIIKRFKYNKVSAVIPGGKERQDSVWAGLRKLGTDTEFVAVHDGARPLLSCAVLYRLLEEAQEWGAAIPGIASKDTLKAVDRDDFVRQTLDRTTVYAIQTPQVFRYKELMTAYRQSYEEDFRGTDDASLFERYIGRVKVIEGDHNNIKITTPGDMIVAQALLRGLRKEETMRIGTGYDVHRLVEGRRLILGGVEIPFDKGLLGHSDADVLLHAVCDALLGAAALGDIGQHFPDTASEYKNIDSLILLRQVGQLLQDKGFSIINLDSTIVAERPKLAPHISAMVANIAVTLGIGVGQVGVKSTTTEGLGFEGRGEGISAQAIALIEGLKGAIS